MLGDLLTYDFLCLILGGIFVTGSANGFNQVIESSSDRKNERTQSHPLPLNILTKTEALIFCVSIGLSGLYLLSLINIKCLLLGLLSIVLYVLVYTPLKKITPFSVFIGAIPGSIPPLLVMCLFLMLLV